MYISENSILVPSRAEWTGWFYGELQIKLIFNLPTIFLCKDEGSLIFSPTRSCLKNINSSSCGNHQADRKRETYDPGSIVLKNCIIIRSLEGDSSGCALALLHNYQHQMGGSLPESLWNPMMIVVCCNLHNSFAQKWVLICFCCLYETDMNVIWGEGDIKGLISDAVAYQKASNWNLSCYHVIMLSC